MTFLQTLYDRNKYVRAIAQKLGFSRPINLALEKNEVKDNINRYVDYDLCVGCGTCCGICPRNAVRMKIVEGKYASRIDNDACKECRLCINVCPVLDWNYQPINCDEKQFFLGHFIKTYVGHSMDETIRWAGASGGVVSALLIFMLENGFIDGAVVVSMNSANSLLPNVLIARTGEDVFSSHGSKYCPVPLNMIIRDLMSERGKFAVVGLPCHIRGLRKVEEFNKKLKEKIVLHIGIFCAHNFTFDGTDMLLAKLGIKRSLVKKMEYRGRGWPGNICVTLHGLFTIEKSFFDYLLPLYSPHFFTPLGCMLCPDFANESSDLSCGDAWIPRILASDREGTSLIISRTEFGEKILRSAAERGILRLTEINPKEVIQAQWGPLEFKKISVGARVLILTHFGKQLEVKSAGEFNMATYFSAVLQLIDAKLGQTRLLRSLIFRLPFATLKAFSYFFGGSAYLSWYLTTGLRRLRRNE